MTDVITVSCTGRKPIYQTAGSAGCDVFADHNGEIPQNEFRIICSGMCLEIPEGFEAQVRSRSGLAAKSGVFVLNAPGTIDSDYRGEVKVILANSGPSPFIIKKGDRIAQLVFSKVYRAAFMDTPELSETARGSGGFGSTGTLGSKQRRMTIGH